MKVWVDKDEWYPVFDLSLNHQSYGLEMDFPDELIGEFHSTRDAFQACQRKIRLLYQEEAERIKREREWRDLVVR